MTSLGMRLVNNGNEIALIPVYHSCGMRDTITCRERMRNRWKKRDCVTPIEAQYMLATILVLAIAK